MNQLRSLLPYYKPYLRGVVAGLVLVVLSNVFTIAGPFLLKLAIDALTSSLSRQVIVMYALLIVGAAVLSGATRFGMRQLLNSISRRIETDLRNDLFSHLLRLPPEFYDRWRTGDLMSRATNDILLDATTFRFDGSDLMPGEIGAGAFWTQMVEFTTGSIDAETAASAIQSRWQALKN